MRNVRSERRQLLNAYANNSNSFTIKIRGEYIEEELIFTDYDSISCGNLGGLWLQ